MIPRFPPMLLALLLVAPPDWPRGAARLSTVFGADSFASTPEPSIPPVVFFPPEPPVYGDPLSEKSVTTRWLFFGRRILPPEGMAEFVGDIIYPALGSRLYSGKLTRALEAQLDRYRNRRNALLNALLEQAQLLRDADDEVRRRGFRDLAARQSAELAVLENEAEELRRALTRDGLFTAFDWNTPRRWRLESFPPHQDWANHEAEFQVARAAAYYQEGLIPAQRGLFRELAMELAESARRARNESAGQTEIDAICFSPETARLRLPPNLPPELLRTIAAFNAQKNTLKRQLREMMHRHEDSSRDVRNKAFAALADEQWPHLVELEKMAEEIRDVLAARFVPQPPAKPSAVPNWLVEMIHPYNEDRNTYYGEMRLALSEATAAVPRPPRHDDPDEQLRLEQEYLKDRGEAQRLAIIQFQTKHAERLAELEKRCAAIRSALETIARTIVDPKTGRPITVEKLLQQHIATMEEFNVFGRATTLYTLYWTAMMQPGLCPEQRRLLFAHAIASLAQPLPHGEPLPSRRAKFPLPR